MPYQVVTFGSATQDIFMLSQKFEVVDDERFIAKQGLCVPLGSKIQMEKVFFAMGGCGTNTAATFVLQGLKAAYLGLVGQDYAGQMVIDELTKKGVPLELLKQTVEWPTALSVILSLPGVDRSILEKLGACHQMTKEDIPFEKIKTSQWFYIASLSDKSGQVFQPIIDFAFQHQIKIAVNPGKRQLGEDLAILRSLLNQIDILILNQEEAARLTGLDFQKEKEIFQKLDEWVNGLVVMTRGQAGVMVSDGKDLYSAGIPQSDLVDRTGAGDAFGSAFVAGWIDQQDISYAIQLATANATACVQELGAANGLLKKGDWGKWEKVEVKKEKIL